MIKFYQSPDIDFLFGYIGGLQIPTKQDKFKPIKIIERNDDLAETILDNFYIKNPDKNSIIDFNSIIKVYADQVFKDGKKIMKPNEVEIILSISIAKESRYKDVDVDNLSKTVLDGLNNIAYEDDSQVTSLICSKRVDPFGKNGILIGVSILSASKIGYAKKIPLFSEIPWNK